MRIYLPKSDISPRPLGRGEYHFLTVDQSSCLLKLKSITVLLYDFSIKNENFQLSLLLWKSCSTFTLRTFSQVLSTVIKIF